MADLPAWMGDKGERRTRNSRSRRQEQDRAEEVDGKVQAGSGSSWRRPEDIRSETTLEQLKFTDGNGYRITVEECIRILEHAIREGREPVLCVEFSRHNIRFVGTVERANRPRT